MEHVPSGSPKDLRHNTVLRAAVEDARPGAGSLCGSYGPGGECVRALGHTDREIYGHDKHVSYDTDHAVSWPVGFRQRIKDGEVCPNCFHELNKE